MAERQPPADVVVIGLGAAGGIAAHVLTQAGAAVVALEAGPALTPEMMSFDEVRNDIRGWLSQPKSAHEAPTWRSSDRDEAGPAKPPTLMVNAVGGSSVHYEGVSLRLQPWNFASRRRIIERYGPGAIPDRSTVADWPLDYDELEPYYDLAEYAVGVAGRAGNVRGRLDPAGNRFEGARSRPYPLPPLRETGWTELMAAGARALGWHPFQAAAAVNSEPYDGRPECTYCGFCGYNGCYRNAKGSTAVTVIPRAEATGLLRVEPLARVVRIDVTRDGLVAGVTYVQDGRECFQPARAVLLGTYTYENTRLLLLSASKMYPRGLSNNHGQVGQHFIAHVTPSVFGTFPGKRLNLFNGLRGQATCVDDWNGDNFDHTDLGFVSGGLLLAMQEAKPIELALTPTPPSIPRWGGAWKIWLKENAQSLGMVAGELDCLPYETTYLDLDPSATDRFGTPVVRVTHAIQPNEERACAFLCEKLETWLQAAGAGETWSTTERRLFVEGRHAYGGTRMGVSPDASVVDRYGFSHEAPNLGIIGASTFPTAGGHNPTLTVQALAWRTAKHLVDDWDAIAA